MDRKISLKVDVFIIYNCVQTEEGKSIKENVKFVKDSTDLIKI